MAAQATVQQKASQVTSVNEFPVVVITHDPEYREVLGETLSTTECQARFPRSLWEARRQIAAQPAPVIAMDATLPAESWSQIMTDIRQSGVRPKIIILRAARNKDRVFQILGPEMLGSDTYPVYDARRPGEVRTAVNKALQARLTEPKLRSAVGLQQQGGI